MIDMNPIQKYTEIVDLSREARKQVSGVHPKRAKYSDINLEAQMANHNLSFDLYQNNRFLRPSQFYANSNFLQSNRLLTQQQQ